MSNITINKIKMQTNYLNSLLEDPTTQRGKIKVEMIMLTHMLENFDINQSKASAQERQEYYEALKRAQKLLTTNNIIGGFDYD